MNTSGNAAHANGVQLSTAWANTATIASDSSAVTPKNAERGPR
jgi:hypothetical protein